MGRYRPTSMPTDIVRLKNMVLPLKPAMALPLPLTLLVKA